MIIKISTPCEEGPSVSINWVDGTGDPLDDPIWDNITRGIHALLAEFPHPKGGWEVIFTCSEEEKKHYDNGDVS